jgi:2,3-bisphosphoglycerate-independent phosphoglycerate mutase
MTNLKNRPIMLLILDGWGYSENTDGNAIAATKKPNFDRIWKECPHTLLEASGLAVGLPPGQMGNSEVGHLHIGAGRFAPQDLTRINLAVENGDFFKNQVLLNTVDKVLKQNSALHVFGLLSDGGIHSHINQIKAMLTLAIQKGLKKIYMHAFLDGRDTPPRSAAGFIANVEELFKQLGCGKFASIGGRYYGMDRDKRWDRVEKAYDMFTLGKSDFHAASAEEALQMAYDRGENDEFVQPTCIHAAAETPVTINDDDAIIFMNFRADRGREISYAFTQKDFQGFPRQKVPNLIAYVTLTEYASDLNVEIAFPPMVLKNVLGEVIANNNLHQLRIAETEKYAHVTYFLNGGEEKVFPNEDRILIPSPKVATYDLQPEMNIFEVTDKLITAINSGKYDFIACNFANPDMVGHTGNFAATVKALEAVDTCLGKAIEALQKVGGEMIVIADHGNAEKMTDESTHQAHTAHTCSPVPFIYVGRKAEINQDHHGELIDVAPTLLYLLGVKEPKEMTGKPLLQLI